MGAGYFMMGIHNITMLYFAMTLVIVGNGFFKPNISTLLGNFYNDENYKDKKGEWVENTQWHTINTWGKTADRVKQYLTKGQEIMLEGKLVHQSYETATGEKRYATVIEATEFLVISEKKEPNKE